MMFRHITICRLEEQIKVSLSERRLIETMQKKKKQRVMSDAHFSRDGGFLPGGGHVLMQTIEKAKASARTKRCC